MMGADCQSSSRSSPLNVQCAPSKALPPLFALWWGTKPLLSPPRPKWLCSERQRNALSCCLPKASPPVPKALTAARPHSPQTHRFLWLQAVWQPGLFGRQNLGTSPSGQVGHLVLVTLVSKLLLFLLYRVHGALTITGSAVFIRAIRY